MRDEEERAICGSSKRIAVAPLLVPSTEKWYSAVREEHFLENRKRLFGAVLDCSVAPRSSSEKPFEFLKLIHVYKVKVGSSSAEIGSQIEEESNRGETQV